VFVQSHNGNPSEAPAPAPAAHSSRWANVALLLFSLLAPFLAIELGYRLAAGLPLLKLANWRTEHVVMVNLGELKAIPDPVLGWTNKSSSYDEDGYTTLEHGIRKNFDETTIRTGGMLAAGDSFTEGWEVKDHESWPAVVEKLTSVPVINAGTGGYGADQTILRAEQMLPIVRPKILLIGFHEIAITRAGHTAFGAPKPYFTFDNGELRHHPATFVQPREKNTIAWRTAYGIREALGYSAFADYLLSRINPNFWHGDPDRDLYQRSGADEVDVTCALLKRLKSRADQDGVHMMLVLQYYATLILESDRPGPYSQAVAACARDVGIRVVDQFAPLHAIVAAGGPAIIRDYYWLTDGVFGHMTAKGNEHAAHLIFTALRDWLPEISGAPSRAEAAPQADDTPQP
jgi:lysophospholipase L1-like esterase